MFCQDIDIRIDPDPLCTPFQIPAINKKARSKKPMKSKTTFKWAFMEIIPATSFKFLTKYTTFSDYLLIGDAYFKIPGFYVMEISTLMKSWTD